MEKKIVTVETLRDLLTSARALSRNRDSHEHAIVKLADAIEGIIDGLKLVTAK